MDNFVVYRIETMGCEPPINPQSGVKSPFWTFGLYWRKHIWGLVFRVSGSGVGMYPGHLGCEVYPVHVPALVGWDSESGGSEVFQSETLNPKPWTLNSRP